jgi:hypothetical protein
MTETTAGNVAEAQAILDRLRDRSIGPGTQLYQNLAQRAIAHAVLAAAGVLGEILALLDGPSIPGLPKGYEITTRQTGNGNRKWRYELTGPGMAYSSRYRYDTSETALSAGIRHARDDAAVPDGLVSVNGHDNDGRIDVYGIANPEAD